MKAIKWAVIIWLAALLLIDLFEGARGILGALIKSIIILAIWHYWKVEHKIPVKLVISTEYHTNSDARSNYELDDHDNWEGAFWDVPSPRNITANLRIEYRDGVGSCTTRDIRLMKYGAAEGGAMLWAYCHLRQANRTFRTDRIITCTDLNTGEIIGNLEVWLDEKYQASPEFAIEKIIETSWDALRVLYFVSKADGRLTKKERIIVREAVRSLSNHPAIDDRCIDDMLDTIDNPTITAFKQAFSRLVKQNRELAVKVAAWSADIVATEKTISAVEQEAMEYFKKMLNKSSIPE